MTLSANPESSGDPGLINFGGTLEKFSHEGHFQFRPNRRGSLSFSNLPATAFPDCPSRAMALEGRSLHRVSNDGGYFDSPSPITAPGPVPAPLRPQSNRRVGAGESAGFGCESEADQAPDNDQKYCEVIWPDFISEMRHFLTRAGGSCPMKNRLSIPPHTERIVFADFRSDQGVSEILFAVNSRCETIDGFAGFTSLVRTRIPCSVRILLCQAFYGCRKLREVYFEGRTAISGRSEAFPSVYHFHAFPFPPPLKSLRTLPFSIAPNCVTLLLKRTVVSASFGGLPIVERFRAFPFLPRLK
jgi:hypothetical protein